MRGRIVKRPGRTRQSSTLPEIGKIKVGDTVRSKNRQGVEYDRPVSLEYFRPTGKYARLFLDQFGDRCDSFTVTFISDDPAESCEERLELRDKAGRLFGTGDGETFRIWNPREGKHVEVSHEDEKVLEWAAQTAGNDWSAVLTLRFIIPEIRGVIGHWSLTTKGDASSIPQIREAFDFVLDQAGTVRGVPFDLQVEKVQSQKPGETRVFPVVRLVPNISQTHIERVRSFLESGAELRGLLTEDRIDELQPKQLEGGGTP